MIALEFIIGLQRYEKQVMNCDLHIFPYDCKLHRYFNTVEITIIFKRIKIHHISFYFEVILHLPTSFKHRKIHLNEQKAIKWQEFFAKFPSNFYISM